MNVHRMTCAAACVLLLFAFTAVSHATETASNGAGGDETLILHPVSFPDIADRAGDDAALNGTRYAGATTTAPPSSAFSGGDDGGRVKRKSTRKAFFLSFLLPGLGETYVGAKRGFINMGVEAIAWWLYLSNTNEGNDLEDEYQDFANTYWHYTDTTDSQGEPLDFNYYKWLQYHFREVGLPDDVDPNDHATINEQLETTVQRSRSSIFGHSVHHLPSTKTQQYYEMIGKYPQFVYGWEDIDDEVNGVPINPTIRDENGNINYEEALQNIKSPLREEYETLRDESNDKLKAGQRGIHLMILNRVFSGIQAARLAYKHNKRLESELSTLDIHFTERYIIDNRVPMVILTKKLK